MTFDLKKKVFFLSRISPIINKLCSFNISLVSMPMKRIFKKPSDLNLNFDYIIYRPIEWFNWTEFIKVKDIKNNNNGVLATKSLFFMLLSYNPNKS